MKKGKTETKKIKLIIIVSLIIFSLVVVSLIYLFDIYKYKRYKSYEKIMDTYDFSKLYNNGTSRSNEYVSDIEAIKIIIAAAYNSSDNVFSLIEEFTTDEMWYEYAKENGIVQDSSENKLNKKTSLIKVIEYISNTKNSILNMDISSEVKPTFSDYKDYNKEQRYAIIDLVSSEILTNNTEKLNGNKKIRKGEFNELIVNFVNKYTLLITNDSLVQNEEDMPSNSEEYPYVLENVEKEVYEQQFEIENPNDFISPAGFYKVEKGNYSEIVKMCENYYNALLNINYQSITKEGFIDSIKKYIIGDIAENKVQEYIDYVVKNHVIISGTATVQMPIVYNDGVDLRVRMKLEFSVESDTKENLLYLDQDYDSKIIYNEKNEIYFDAKLGYTLNSGKAYNYQRTIYTMILDKYKDNIQVVGK